MGYILLSYGINIAFRIYTSFQINVLLSAEVPRCGDLFFCIHNLLFAPAFGFCQLNIELYLNFTTSSIKPYVQFLSLRSSFASESGFPIIFFKHLAPLLDLSSPPIAPVQFRKKLFVFLCCRGYSARWKCGIWDTRRGVSGVVSENNDVAVNRMAS